MLKLATKFAPFSPQFETAAQAGFRWAELYLDPAILADWARVAAQARQYPLGYALHFPNRLALAPAVLDDTVALYRALQSGCLVIHQPLFDKYGALLLDREPALRLAVENHWLSPAGLEEWAERNPGLTLDVEHLWKFTLGEVPLEKLLETLRDFLARFGDKVRHVHLPGFLPGNPEHRPMYCARDLVFAVWSLLAEFKFAGLVVSEVDADYQNAQELRMDVLLYQAWLQCQPG